MLLYIHVDTWVMKDRYVQVYLEIAIYKPGDGTETSLSSSNASSNASLWDLLLLVSIFPEATFVVTFLCRFEDDVNLSVTFSGLDYN